MGKAVVSAKIENLEDVFAVRQGTLAPENVRKVEVPDALIDTSATGLMVPKRLIDQLGLVQFKTRSARTINGQATLGVFRAVQLTVQGRDCIIDVYEVPDDIEVLIGQIPLEAMDWVVDPIGQKLIGNPAHGGEFMIDAL